MAHLIPQAAVERYAAAPAATTITTARILQERIRDALGPEYETFLQGSYKNDTATREFDDVDIVAVRKDEYTTMFSNPGRGPARLFWRKIFSDVQNRISADHRFKGRTQRRDKCVKVRGRPNADVVPAVTVITAETDPIAIWSWGTSAERLNSPRVHYENAVGKHQRTKSYYKPTVRMLKNWALRQFGERNRIAPSFYLECLVYNVPDLFFLTDGAERFALVTASILGLSYDTSAVRTVAGDKCIFVPNEWPKGLFQVFQGRLRASHRLVRAALEATTQTMALVRWKRAFNE